MQRIRSRIRRWWRDACVYTMRPPRPTRDLEAEAIEKELAWIGRLEIAAGIGSMYAAAQLTDLAVDRVGQARRAAARAALERLGARAPAQTQGA